jgi:hypothetical protein
MNNKPNPIGFYLQKITTEQYAVIEENYTEGGNVELSVNLKFRVNKDHKLISVLAQIKFDQKKQPFLILEAACIFSIEEKAWTSFQKSAKENKTVTVPQGFMSHLSVITIGTARGILHEKTAGTGFNKFLLPTVNVTELIQGDITFQ